MAWLRSNNRAYIRCSADRVSRESDVFSDSIKTLEQDADKVHVGFATQYPA